MSELREEILEAERLLAEVPFVKRARGWRLYTKKGERILDLYGEGGKAVLGHRPGQVGRVLKNEISKGLYLRVPSVYLFRLRKALRAFLPTHPHLRLFPSHEALLAHLASRHERPYTLHDPALPASLQPHRSPLVAWARPFLPPPPTPLAIPVFPIPGLALPGVLCAREESLLPDVPDALASPLLLAAMTRSIHDLLGAGHLFQGVGHYLDALPPPWRHTGPYLYLEEPPRDHPTLFRRFLSRGILVSPSPGVPGVFPAEISPGEWALFRRTAEEVSAELFP
ncbi:hypothetical protein [Spirochaeta thermophila]|uniref:Aminotransferase class-III n=1 Tax=Winmispira thermophila (strain ATCC 49972 / DSM 6192 / RI 19.B1) TaxID=665571 RepID=E0RR74_WINT6|nr:hypothetical protein [Spirochaeta thermophila]ADN03051.1 hypothetical protein STHERM_c21200 [Spirochaeta thermophila DSM 6192]